MAQLFVDMDGVLADFDTHYMNLFGEKPRKHPLSDKDGHDIVWDKIQGHKDFYLTMPPMKDMRTLWNFVGVLKPRPIVLTGIPWSIPEAPSNKKRWGLRNLGALTEVRCCPSKEKYIHCQPGDVIVDDWDKYRHLWEAQGGIWVTHTSAENSIRQLKELQMAGRL